MGLTLFGYTYRTYIQNPEPNDCVIELRSTYTYIVYTPMDTVSKIPMIGSLVSAACCAVLIFFGQPCTETGEELLSSSTEYSVCNSNLEILESELVVKQALT